MQSLSNESMVNQFLEFICNIIHIGSANSLYLPLDTQLHVACGMAVDMLLAQYFKSPLIQTNFVETHHM